MAPIHSCGEAGDRGSAMSGRKALRVSTPIKRLVASPLLRHLAAVQIGELGARGTRLNNASLALLVQHAPCLTSLQCWLKLTPTVPLVLPPRLTLLELRLEDNYTDAAINGVLTVLATLPSLSQLLLRLRAFQRETRTEVSLLAASRSLTELTLDAWYGNPQLTSTQLEQIRSSLGHLQRINVGWLGSYDLARLLQPPVTARWQDIGNVIGDELTGELLISLQSLTNLELTWEADFYDAEIVRVDFLPQLPRLTSLNLYSADFLDSAHWTALFAKLTIKKLTLRAGRIDTLRCFAAGPITQSLEELTINGLMLPPSEISHLHALRRLRSLLLTNCFTSRVNDACLNALVPPSPLLPALTKLFYMRVTANGRWERLERQGPSFEWLQQLKQ